jgi:hypothetical protein
MKHTTCIKENQMKNKFVLIIALLAVALVSAACAAQEATNEPGAVTTMPATSTDGVATLEGTSETAPTPTGATPATGADETSTAPTTSPDGSGATQGASGTAVIPQTGGGGVVAGAPDDLDEVMRVLREAGAAVELGDTVQQDFLSVPGQSIRVNGKEVQVFTYDDLETLEIQVSQVEDLNPPEGEAHFYKLGNMLVRYVDSDPGVRDLLEDVLGAQAVGE